MRIVCPSCTAAYQVPDAMLRSPRMVRCARCGMEWMPQTAEDEVSPPPADAEPAFEQAFAPPPLPTPSPPIPTLQDRLELAARAAPVGRGGGLRAVIEWTGSVAILAALIWAAYTWREPIMHAWPPSTRLYSVLGLA